MDIKKMAENLGLEEDEYIEMLQLFIESGGADLAKLEAALKEGNAEKAHEASHSFKGSSGSLGLDRLYQLVKAIDDQDRKGSLDGLAEKVKNLRCEYDNLVRVVNEIGMDGHQSNDVHIMAAGRLHNPFQQLIEMEEKGCFRQESDTNFIHCRLH